MLEQNNIKIKERIKELKEQIGKKVYYNNMPYIIKQICNVVENNDNDIEIKPTILLVPVTPISVNGDDILNIKDLAIATIKHSDGHFEIKSISDNGQQKNNQGIIEINESNNKNIVDKIHKLKKINDEGISISKKIMRNDVNKKLIEQASENINTFIEEVDKLKTIKDNKNEK